jgi:hypothetical protein
MPNVLARSSIAGLPFKRHYFLRAQRADGKSGKLHFSEVCGYRQALHYPDK